MTARRAAQAQARSRCGLVQFELFEERRGSLCVAEVLRQISFEVRRVYWVFGVPPGGERAHHANRAQHEMLVAVTGAFTVHCDDGRVRSEHRLSSPDRGLLIPEMVWHHLDDFTDGAVCLALASGTYEPSDYVRDYDEFLELTAGW